MPKCKKCDMDFTSVERLARHFNTHLKKAKKNKKTKDKGSPDFDKPDFTQVM